MKKILIFIIIFLLSWPVIWEIMKPGTYPVHDDTQTARVVAMGRALLNGQFPVRWVNDLGYGYGYPIFSFYGPLPYYVGGFLYSIGIEGLTAAKIMTVVGFFTAGITMFLLLKNLTGYYGAIIGAVLYIYAPYHASLVFVRGAIGELWAYAFLPLTAAFYLNGFENKRNNFVYTVIGLSGIILSHTIYGYLTVVFVIFFSLIFIIIRFLKEKGVGVGRFFEYLKPVIISLLLTAFFWLPAISEISYTGVRQMVEKESGLYNHFVCLPQLVSSPWGFGGSQAGCVDGMSFKLGKAHILLAIITVLAFFLTGKKSPILKGNIILVLIVLFFMTDWSWSLWKIIPMSEFIQYPWRLLTVAAFGMAIIGSYINNLTKSRIILLGITVFIIFSVIYINAEIFRPQNRILHQQMTDSEISNDMKNRVSRISDEYLPADFDRTKGQKYTAHDTISMELPGNIVTEKNRESDIRVRFESQANQKVTVNRAYFPGWKYWLNGNEIKPEIIGGLPYFKVGSGHYLLEMKLIDTPVRILGNIVSFVGLILFILKYGKKTFC